MTNYIDKDKLIRDLIDNRNFYPAIVKRAIEQAPTEDVVPRAEVEELQKKLVVQKRCNNELVKICEKLNKDLAEFENKQFSCDSCDRIALTSAEHKHCIEQAKQDVAREIFEEIEKPILSQLGISTMEKKEAYYFCLDIIADLKKKHIGE